MPIGDNLKRLRLERGLSGYALSKKTGGRLSASHIAQIESGKIAKVETPTAKLLAEALESSLEELLSEPGARILELNEDIPAYTNHDRPRPHRTITVPVRALIPAGNPIEAFEDTGETFELLPHLHGPDREVIKIVGDSMYPLLRDGYLVLVDRKPSKIKNRDVVVAIHKGESTIKRYYKEGKYVTLRAENERLPPIVVAPEDEFRIAGKATTIVEGRIE